LSLTIHAAAAGFEARVDGGSSRACNAPDFLAHPQRPERILNMPATKIRQPGKKVNIQAKSEILFNALFSFAC